jgi:pimeloyl-ACP methyl ester carboxylesterase
MRWIARSTRVLNASVAATRWLGRYSARLSAIPGRILWFTPWEVPVSERGLAKQAGWLEGTEPFSIEISNGRRIAGYAAGSGPVVLLVHGWGERAAALGGFIAPLTAAGYRVVGIDLPAHGDSTGARTNILDSGDAIREVAQSCGGAHAVISHSMGANAVLWAIKEGLEVDRLVMLAPNVDLTSAFDTFQQLFSLPTKAITGLKRSIERRFGKGVWMDFRGDVLALGLETPGLIFHDPDDPVVSFTGSRDLVTAWRTAELVEMPNLGHGTITRDPAVIQQAVSFIDGPLITATPYRADADPPRVASHERHRSERFAQGVPEAQRA